MKYENFPEKKKFSLTAVVWKIAKKVKFISFVDAKKFSIALNHSFLYPVNDPHGFYYSE